jgi:hypothetical protein
MAKIEPVEKSRLQKDEPIIILGMHRSGTSLTTRLLSDMGLFTGAQLSVNAEEITLRALNEKIFRRAGGDWSRPAPIRKALRDNGWVSRQKTFLRQQLFDRAKIRAFFGHRSWRRFEEGKPLVWGWKDPRMMLLYPLWASIFPRARYLHIVRNGLDVAVSLHRRATQNQQWWKWISPFHNPSRRVLSIEACFALWEEYLDAYLEHRDALCDRPLLEINYETLLATPKEMCKRLAVFCGLSTTDASIAHAAARINPQRLDNRARRRPYGETLARFSSTALMKRYGYGPRTGSGAPSSQPAENSITVLTVSWHSARYLEHLLDNLAVKAARPQSLKGVIVDNTDGRDAQLTAIAANSAFSTLDIISHRPDSRGGSWAHGSGLNKGLRYVDTPYVLIVDPDIHVFLSSWDERLPQLLHENNGVAAGAPYPFWKLGKYHDFPSPIFLFARTSTLTDLGADWSPFAPTRTGRLFDLALRQIVRMGIVGTRARIENHAAVRHTGRLLERMFGVRGPDTGWKIAAAARKRKLRSVLLTPVWKGDPWLAEYKNQRMLEKMAANFEIYRLGDKPVLIHRYSTGSYFWRTGLCRDDAVWWDGIAELENNVFDTET